MLCNDCGDKNKKVWILCNDCGDIHNILDFNLAKFDSKQDQGVLLSLSPNPFMKLYTWPLDICYGFYIISYAIRNFISECAGMTIDEANSEVYVLSFARHKNRVMFLGYCCTENKNILIYEYICNTSLYWHLFENSEAVLDWPQRFGIALGIVKGLLP